MIDEGDKDYFINISDVRVYHSRVKNDLNDLHFACNVYSFLSRDFYHIVLIYKRNRVLHKISKVITGNF